MRILLIILILTSFVGYSQDKKTFKIINEGKLLFRLEKGSWYGTDDMLSRFSNKKDSIGGYLSYETTDNEINTIFFSRFDSNKILIRYTFNSSPKPNPIKIDTINNLASELERSLIKIRQDAKEKVSENSDDFFKFYDNTAFNFIPVINNNQRSVFILTGPQVSGVVVIGNDYKLIYDKNNQFIKKEKIHNSLLQFPFKSDNIDNKTESTFHSHVLTEYISSTDICTLLLYKDFVEWKQHYVISNKYVSIFDLEKETLTTIKRKDWEKLTK